MNRKVKRCPYVNPEKEVVRQRLQVHSNKIRGKEIFDETS